MSDISDTILRVLKGHARHGGGGVTKDLLLAYFDGESDPRDESAAILEEMIGDGELAFDGTFVRLPRGGRGSVSRGGRHGRVGRS